MTVKEILKTVATILKNKDAYNYLTDAPYQNCEEAQMDANLMLTCYNVIADELATEHFKLKAVETLESSDGEVKLENLSKNPISVISVNSLNGEKLNVKILPTKILTDQSVKIEYSYTPSPKGFDDISDFTGTPITSRILSYGIATEYLLIKGGYEEAMVWHEKYVSALKGALTTKGGKIKAREWR